MVGELEAPPFGQIPKAQEYRTVLEPRDRGTTNSTSRQPEAVATRTSMGTRRLCRGR